MWQCLFLRFIIGGYVYSVVTWESKSQKTNEKVIREAVAAQLNKDPNELTDEDFELIKKLNLAQRNVYDIRLLGKFKNIEELNLSFIPLPQPDIPKWMIILAKLHAIDLYKNYYKSYKEKYFIDLSPLEKLFNLRVLYMNNTAIKNIEPLAKIKNLREINIDIGMLDEHGLFDGGIFPKTVLINGKEFNLQIDHNTNDSFPKINCIVPGYDGTPEQQAEILIKSKCENVLN